ncbi:MAG: HAMP domain-containing protein [Spartobacteria bacterium]|nr:HAMP domain-containing protein [Spartobacteria bacterium]
MEMHPLLQRWLDRFRPKNYSIRSKLLSAMMVSTLCYFILAAILFMWLAYRSEQKSLVTEINSIAGVVGKNCVAALDFFDVQAATERLPALAADKEIVAACIYDADGKVFATYETGVKTVLHEEETRSESAVFRNDMLLVYRPVLSEGQPVGGIAIEVQLSALRKRIQSRFLWIGLCILLASGMSFIVSTRMQRLILGPVFHLAALARKVSEQRDYSLRTNWFSKDEAGQLARSFDDMLSEIQKRDQELEKHREHLEEMIAQRTEELCIAKDKAESAAKAKSVFLATMSHELRTPLNVILGYAQMLLAGKDCSAKGMTSIEMIQHSGEHLLLLINDVLDISRIEANRMQLDMADVSLQDIVSTSVGMIQVRANEKGLKFIYEDDGALPACIQTDAKRLRQILLNLLSNAVKYTEEGTVCLVITHKQDSLCFSVRDTGIGIPDEQLETIFEPFMQVPCKSRIRDGSGLGLAICSNLLRMMGSELHVESCLGQGSCFSFTLHDVVIHTGQFVEYMELSDSSSSVIHSEPVDPESIIRFPASDMDQAYHLCCMGDITGLKSELIFLQEQFPQNKEWLQKCCVLADRFLVDEVKTQIKLVTGV